MKILRKLRKNAKALSPVVASIILIAVTVAVSIAVAAWMGALTVGFMGTEELKITKADFPSGAYVDLTVRNTGTSPVTIESARINGASVACNATTDSIAANSVVTVRLTNGADIVDGNNYEMKLLTTKGNTFMYTAVAPST
jgi:flagellin-like protein